MSWTADKVEQLKQLWAEGKSASEIGRIVGMSRNAVIGKAHRIGVPARRTPSRPVKLRLVGKALPPSPYKIGAVPLLALDETSCRWPCGDPKEKAFGFCGLHRLETSPYCPEHAARSRVGWSEKRLAELNEAQAHSEAA